jgi:hypothetical protein
MSSPVSFFLDVSDARLECERRGEAETTVATYLLTKNIVDYRRRKL